MELERVGGPNDPVEGTDVRLICRVKKRRGNSFPKWSCQINGHGKMRIINENSPPPGLTLLENRRWP